MKFVQPFPLYIFALAGLGVSGANGYVYSSGQLGRRSFTSRNGQRDDSSGDNKNYASSFQNGHYKQRRDSVDQAFRCLQDKLGCMDGEFNRLTIGSTQIPFQKFDEETAKKWLDKAFDLASEFNKDFATSPTERDNTDEIIQKSRDWVARFYEDKGIEEESDESTSASPSNQADSSTSPENEQEDTENATNGPDGTSTKNGEVISEIPNSENISSEEMFRVTVDLPGVARGDVDVTLDDAGNFLVITASRKTEGADQRVRMYKKKIVFVESEMDVNKMEARLSNGLLFISAPKIKPTEKKRKIAVTY